MSMSVLKKIQPTHERARRLFDKLPKFFCKHSYHFLQKIEGLQLTLCRKKNCPHLMLGDM